MTNLQKASNLISDILDLKLGVGDIVEYKIDDLESDFEIDRISTKGGSYKLFRLGYDYVKYYIESEDLKLKQRNITLPMVLEAMNEKYPKRIKNGFIGISIYINAKDGSNVGIVMEKFIINEDNETLMEYDWQLRKDNQDLSLFDQKNDKLYKFLIKVLK